MFAVKCLHCFFQLKKHKNLKNMQSDMTSMMSFQPLKFAPKWLRHFSVIFHVFSCVVPFLCDFMYLHVWCAVSMIFMCVCSYVFEYYVVANT